jgi:hypothetical protein
VSFVEDSSPLGAVPCLSSGLPEPLITSTRSSKAMRNRVNLIAAHMLKQLKEHEDALANTNRVFEQLLEDLEGLCDCFRESFAQRNIPASRVFSEVDADRSVGILNVLWHSISFTSRGNTKPLALFRPSRQPIFTGRILALQGDFHDVAIEIQDQEYPGMLQYEIASLYIPADTTAPAVMKVKHLGEEEHFLHQADAPRLFLLKTVEMICGGGFYHEKEF